MDPDVSEITQTLLQWAIAVIGWMAAAVVGLVAWIFNRTVIVRMEAMESRMVVLERLASAAVTQIDLSKSIDGLRDELTATRMEIKTDVRQLLEMLKR